MVQIDAVWVYGIGAGFALADAPRSVVRGDRTPAFTHALGYLAVFFAPCGVWLLTAFPSWETMHVLSSPPGWVAGLFCAATVVFGLVGFVCTAGLLARGKEGWAFLQWIWPHAGLFFVLIYGWDGTGLERFVTTDRSSLAAAVSQSVPELALQWCGTPVARTLIGMGVVVIPVMAWMVARCRTSASGGADRRAGWRFACLLTATAVGPCLAVAVLASVGAALVGTVPACALVVTGLCWVMRPGTTLARWVSAQALPAPSAVQGSPCSSRADVPLPARPAVPAGAPARRPGR
ncbi:hypothetical protein ACFQ2B_40065 [Streptomyces stramineus]|uniref:Uncharacterized protein n=1 Tax=Streptomyces stramineus TaxID=173861 RepID=A0ABN0ZPG2_9ACTN